MEQLIISATNFVHQHKSNLRAKILQNGTTNVHAQFAVFVNVLGLLLVAGLDQIEGRAYNGLFKIFRGLVAAWAMLQLHSVNANEKMPKLVQVYLFSTAAASSASFTGLLLPTGTSFLNLTGSFGFGFCQGLLDALPNNSASRNMLDLFMGTFFGVWTSFPAMLATAAELGSVVGIFMYFTISVLFAVFCLRLGRYFCSLVLQNMKNPTEFADTFVNLLPFVCAFSSVSAAIDVYTFATYGACFTGCLFGDVLSESVNWIPNSNNYPIFEHVTSNIVSCIVALVASGGRVALENVFGARLLFDEMEGSFAGSASAFCDTVVATDETIRRVFPGASKISKFIWNKKTQKLNTRTHQKIDSEDSILDSDDESILESDNESESFQLTGNMDQVRDATTPFVAVLTDFICLAILYAMYSG